MPMRPVVRGWEWCRYGKHVTRPAPRTRKKLSYINDDRDRGKRFLWPATSDKFDIVQKRFAKVTAGGRFSIP